MRLMMMSAVLAAFGSQVLAVTVAIQPSDFLPSAQVLTFETGSTTLPSAPGVTYLDDRAQGASTFFASNGSFNDAFFGEQIMANLVSTEFSDMGLEFSPPVQAVGAWFGKIDNFLNQNPDKITFRAYGASGELLASTDVELSYPQQGDEPVFAGFRSDRWISRVTWLGNDQGFFGVDNVMYGVAVPEPASASMLLALLVCRRRDG